MWLDGNTEVFLSLVSAGLWSDAESADLRNHGFKEQVDWGKIYRLASEQSLLGFVLAGIENSIVRPPQEMLLQWIGEVQIIEQQNKTMNKFVAMLFEKLRQEGIYALLVKGQGVAQCYERPLWRTSGDIDLLLDGYNYENAKALLIPLAEVVQSEDTKKKHQAIIINDFDIELHGKMPFGLSRRADKVVDDIIEDSLKRGGARVWTINKSNVYLPNTDNDVILVFTHFLRHFFIEGVGLRQICDWCRLLWTFKDSLNRGLLESRICKAGLMKEWQVFGALAVKYLGMPAEAMPFYKDSQGMRRKAKHVLARVMKSGNFGHNKDLSYRAKYTGLSYRLVAFWRRLVDFIGLSRVFPIDGPKFFATYLFKKVC